MQIFRIVDIAVLIKMFKENKNSLSSPNNWSDHWEKLDIEIKNKQEGLQFKKYRTGIYSQCWSKEGYSWALWKMNSPHGNGVRIKTTKKKLYDSLPVEIKRKYTIDEIINGVAYLKEKEIKLKIGDIINSEGISFDSISKMYLWKRSAFEYEKEIRMIIPYRDESTILEVETIRGKKYLSYTTNPCSFLESIYFDSNIDDYLFEVYKDILKDFKFKGTIKKSAIDIRPKKIKIN